MVAIKHSYVLANCQQDYARIGFYRALTTAETWSNRGLKRDMRYLTSKILARYLLILYGGISKLVN